MKEQKWKRRDKKYRKNRYGMGVSGRSLTVIKDVIIKKGEEARKDKKK